MFIATCSYFTPKIIKLNLLKQLTLKIFNMKAITKLGLAVLLLLFTGLFSSSFAQSHNVKALGCKYYQKSGNGAAVNTYEVCTVSMDKKEKEQKAKAAEDKRRHQIS